jgi:hypothetical protein
MQELDVDDGGRQLHQLRNEVAPRERSGQNAPTELVGRFRKSTRAFPIGSPKNLRRLDGVGADQPIPDGIPEQDGKNEWADDPAR